MSRIHLLSRDNGAGLSRDLAILARVLADGGFDVAITAVGHGRLGNRLRHLRLRTRLAWAGWRGGAAQGCFDANIMVERIWPEYVPLARRTALIPNPEWFKPEFRAQAGMIDRLFVKTQHAVPLFEALRCDVRFVGFTSADRRLTGVARERSFLHLAGRSGNKGTQPLIDLWRRHPDWPTLTIVQRAKRRVPTSPAANLEFVTRFLSDDELRLLQNRKQLQLCPSETEGFGHHLVEGMSVGAVILATDAPPMNEMIADDRGVRVSYARTGTQQLATTYFVDADTLEPGVERMLALDENERRRLGENARAWWEQNDRAFRARLVDAVGDLVRE